MHEILTAAEKRAYFQHILSGEAKVLGGSRSTMENGQVVNTTMSPEELLAEEVVRAREYLGLPPKEVLPDRPSDFRIIGGHEIRP